MGHVPPNELRKMVKLQHKVESDLGDDALAFAFLMLANIAVRNGISLEETFKLVATCYTECCATMN